MPIDRDQEEEFLDRLSVRDRAFAARREWHDRATKLVARLLLETGRPTEAVESARCARGRRHGCPERGSVLASAPSLADREAAWLLSRAALQLDQDETADAMLALAGDFGTTAAGLPEPAPYVGSGGAASAIAGSIASSRERAATRRRFVSGRP